MESVATEISATEQVKRVPTKKICLDDIRYEKDTDRVMILMGQIFEAGLADLLHESRDSPIKSIKIDWINRPHLESNRFSTVGFFTLTGTR